MGGTELINSEKVQGGQMGLHSALQYDVSSVSISRQGLGPSSIISRGNLPQSFA
jgi:hypothetical protein